MIEARALTARSAPVALAPLTLDLGVGVHALLGRAEDGVPLVLAAMAGRVRARGGSVRVLGKPPGDMSASIAYVPRDVVLPEALRVDEMLELGATIRGEAAQGAAERLGALGVATLATRRVRSLTPGEARAVALTFALTCQAPVLLLEEPYMALDPRAASVLGARLRERAKRGACVVVGTASVRDAADLADGQLVFDRGVLVKAFSPDGSLVVARAPVPGPRADAPARRVRLSLAVSDVARILPLLAAEPAVLGIESDRASIVLRGTDATELAAAVGRALRAANVELSWLHAEAPSLEELRA